jgi:MarR family transcriptional regulator for hemolysin
MNDDGAVSAAILQEEDPLPSSAGPACSNLNPLLGANLLWFGRALTRRFDALLARRRPGLTMAQARILFTLDNSGPVTQRELAELTEVEPSTLGRTIDHMERQGLVERRDNPTDRRQRMVQLHAAGHQELDQLIAFFEETEEWLTRDIPEERVQQLVNDLTSLRERLTTEEGEEPCTTPATAPQGGGTE